MKSKTWINLIVMTGLLVAAFGGMPYTQPAAQAAAIIRVKPGGSTSYPCGDGWANACDLQTALTNASAGDEIWAAAGTYKPGTNRDATFQLVSGVALYGGFAGTETSREQRNWEANLSMLSGDIGVQGDISDNSYHVVTGSGVDATAILDGFTITEGNADGWYEDSGAGMFNQGGSPSLINLTFIGNSANYGGGIYNIDHSNPALIDVIFNGNQAGGGGGMSNVNSNPMLTNVTFSGNSAGYCGGMFNSGSSPVLISVTFSGNISSGMCNWDASDSSLTNVSFSGNSAEAGGGMNNVQSSPILTNVTFSGNSAEAQGGGMYCEGGSPTLKDVTFFGNTAGYGGGGMHNTNNSPTLTNVTFSGNDAGDYGGGMSNWSSSPTLTNVTFSGNEAQDGGGMVNGGSSLTIANTILWGNTAGASGPQIYNDETSATSIQYSDVQGGCAAIQGNDCSSGGNIDADPQFVRNPHPGPDATWGTEDDDYGDLRLMYDSPTIDAGDNTAPGLAGIITDLGGNPRFYDVPGIAGTGVGPPPLVDMGAYEKQANDAPATGYDSYTTKVDVPLNVSAPGILTNDRDPDGELISAMLKSRPSSGSLSLNPDGSFEYLPETVFSGVVTFTYYATDGLLDSYSATVTIDVELYEVFLPLINH